MNGQSDDNTKGIISGVVNDARADLPVQSGNAAYTGLAAGFRFPPWISWFIAFAMIATVIFVALHFSEQREFVRIAESAQPWWFAVALVLQGGTYFLQAAVWKTTFREANSHLPLPEALKLSLAKLFIDQALPSGGLSGAIVVARAMEGRGVPLNIVMGAMVVNVIANYTAIVVALALALTILVVQNHADFLIISAAFLFVVFSAVLIASMFTLAGRSTARLGGIQRIAFVRKAFELLRQADAALVRRPSLIIPNGQYSAGWDGGF